jgi:hypothetical protein
MINILAHFFLNVNVFLAQRSSFLCKKSLESPDKSIAAAAAMLQAFLTIFGNALFRKDLLDLQIYAVGICKARRRLLF